MDFLPYHTTGCGRVNYAIPVIPDVVGEFVEIASEFCGEWRIPDFLSLPQKVDIYCWSEKFFFAGASWILKIYPNGRTESKSEGWIGMFLFRSDNRPSLKLSYSVGVKKSSGAEENRFHTAHMLFKENSGWGREKCLERTDLLSRKADLVPSGVLTIICRMKTKRQSSMDGFKKLQTDLKTILDSGVGCDVTIKVRGKEFLAHSFFLQARSPVFQSMFSHEMVEKLSGVVVIDDCDPETFPDLLNYLYTGNTNHISDKNVCQLFTAADKYQVLELKEQCAAYMKDKMSVDNFCNIVAVALRHSEKELIDLSTDFFCANVGKIAKTATWQTFLHENTTAGNELFLKFLSKEKYI